MPKQTYKTVDETVVTLIEEYTRETKGQGPLWAGSARLIVAVLTNNDAKTAQKILRKQGNHCKGMAVSDFYFSAADELHRAIRRAKYKARIISAK